MKLSTRSRYGARILLELARHSNTHPVRGIDISRRQNIPVKYLEKLVRTMKSLQLVHSVRGPKGGYILAKSPEEISLGTIVRLFEGTYELVSCISTPNSCQRAGRCRVRLAWKLANQALYQKLDAISLADLLCGIDDE